MSAAPPPRLATGARPSGHSEAVVTGVLAGVASRLEVDPLSSAFGFVVAVVASGASAVALRPGWIFLDEGGRRRHAGAVNRVESAVLQLKIATGRSRRALAS